MSMTELLGLYEDAQRECAAWQEEERRRADAARQTHLRYFQQEAAVWLPRLSKLFTYSWLGGPCGVLASDTGRVIRVRRKSRDGVTEWIAVVAEDGRGDAVGFVQDERTEALLIKWIGDCLFGREP